MSSESAESQNQKPNSEYFNAQLASSQATCLTAFCAGDKTPLTFRRSLAVSLGLEEYPVTFSSKLGKIDGRGSR